MPWLLRFLRLGFFSFCFAPAFFYYLAGPAQGQGIGRDIFGDCGCGGYVCALSDPNRRNQDAVAAYENAFFDDGVVLADPVVVTGDGSRAHVYFLADFGVSQIGQMVCLGAFADAGLLQFNKISDVGIFADFATWAQMAVRAERGACPDHGMFKYAARLDQDLISDFAA